MVGIAAGGSVSMMSRSAAWSTSVTKSLRPFARTSRRRHAVDAADDDVAGAARGANAMLSRGCMRAVTADRWRDERAAGMTGRAARIPTCPFASCWSTPSHPGNIGAAARAMKNMGLDRAACWCAPRALSARRGDGARLGRRRRARARARRARACTTPIADCGLVVGTTRAAAAAAVAHRRAARGGAARSSQRRAGATVAVLFGAERTGLTNEELERCHLLITIPADPRLQLAESRDGRAGRRLRALARAPREPRRRAPRARPVPLASARRKWSGSTRTSSRCWTRSTSAIAPAAAT